MVEGSNTSSPTMEANHLIPQIPVGDTPYAWAKRLQLVEKNLEAAVALFWAAINAGDRVESALKDMAVLMKQLGRPLEAIEAIKSFRHLCSPHAQESLDNILLDLYKKCRMLDEQIVLLKEKLRLTEQGLAFNGKPTKTARSHGKKFQVSLQQEASRLLTNGERVNECINCGQGNLGWAYMQQFNYAAAEMAYRKAQRLDPDMNKACNLGFCLIKQGKREEAAAVLEDVGYCTTYAKDPKYLERAKQLLKGIRDFKLDGGSRSSLANKFFDKGVEKKAIRGRNSDELERISKKRDAITVSLGERVRGLDNELSASMVEWASKRHRRLPVFEEIIPIEDISG